MILCYELLKALSKLQKHFSFHKENKAKAIIYKSRKYQILLLRTKKCDHLKQGSSCSNRMLWCLPLTYTSLTGTSVKFKAVFLDTKEIVRSCTRCQELKVGDRVSVAWFFEDNGELVNTVQLVVKPFAVHNKKCWLLCWWRMAEQCIVTLNYAVKVPEKFDPAQASSNTCAGIYNLQSYQKKLKAEPGQSDRYLWSWWTRKTPSRCSIIC